MDAYNYGPTSVLRNSIICDIDRSRKKRVFRQPFCEEIDDANLLVAMPYWQREYLPDVLCHYESWM
jgi:hypothetical protein